MAAQRGIVAEFLVFNDLLARTDRVEEVCLMIDHVAIPFRRGKDFGPLFDFNFV